MTIRAVLDANVLYPFHLRDFLLTAASKRFALFIPFWSREILTELSRHHPSKQEKTDRLVWSMSQHFPEAEVADNKTCLASASSLRLPDKNDYHVVATAIGAKAAFIVTDNIKDFPSKELDRIGIQAVRPGSFAALLADTHGDAVLMDVVSLMVSRYQNPKRTVAAVRQILSKHEVMLSVRK